MEKKFEVELNKVEKLLEKVDNDLLRQGLRSDFTVFFKNMDKTFEIYNVCLEELCGQLYLMDLAFHSRVVRKLFHNYKHSLHTVMKYQLTLQKELNLKYQQEKQMKSELEKLEIENKKTADALMQEKSRKKDIDLNFGDDNQIREEKLNELNKKRQQIMADGQAIQQQNEEENKMMSEIDKFLKEEKGKTDSAEVKNQLFKLLKTFEDQKKRLEELEHGVQKYAPDGTPLMSQAQMMKKEYATSGTNTEVMYYDEDSVNDLKQQYMTIKNINDQMETKLRGIDSERKLLEDTIEDLKSQITNGSETIDHLTNLLATEKHKCQDKDLEIQTALNQKEQFEIRERLARERTEELEKELLLFEQAREKIRILEAELESLKKENASLNETLKTEREENNKILESKQIELNTLKNEQAKMKTNYEKLVKGGDYAEESVKNFVETLKNELREVTEERDKFSALYEKLKQRSDELARKNRDQESKLKDLEEQLSTMQQDFAKAQFIIQRVSEGEGSIWEEDDADNDQNVPVVDDPMSSTHTKNALTQVDQAENPDDILKSAINTDTNFNAQQKRKKKPRKLKMEMIDKEVEAFMKSFSTTKTKITFTKNCQSEYLSPLNYLMESKDDLLQKPLNYEQIKDCMDLLASLLGYQNLDAMIHDKKGSKPTGGASNRQGDDTRKVTKKITRVNREDDGNLKKDSSRKKLVISPQRAANKMYESDNDEEDDYDPSNYPQLPKYQKRLPQQRDRHASHSPEKNFDPYYDDFTDLARSRRIIPARRVPTDKEQEEAYLRQLSDEEARNGRSLSKNRMEKEVALFKMYMNIKKRYFKDPEKFLKVFKIYFGRDPPKVRVPQDGDDDQVKDEFLFTYEEFREYYANLVHLHDKCGDECIHLTRFYNRMGIHKELAGKKFLVLKKQVIDKLPKSKPKRKNSLEKLVRRYYRYY